MRLDTSTLNDSHLLPHRHPAHAVDPPSETPVRPALATLVDSVPVGDDWQYEVKFDGYRLLGHVQPKHVALHSRNGQDWTRKFRPLAAALQELPCKDAVLDGEVVVLRPDGTSDFQGLQTALGQHSGGLHYYIFDLLSLDGHDLRGLPLHERQDHLQALLATVPRDGMLQLSEPVQAAGDAVLAQACEHGLEGIVAKRKDSLYHAGHTLDWVKIKCSQRQEFVVGGFTASTRERVDALLLGTYDAAGRLQYAGRVEDGMDDATRAAVRQQLQVQAAAAFAAPPKYRRGIYWAHPTHVAEVAFSSWTQAGLLRHGQFKGMRADKAAQQVVREHAAPAPSDVKHARAAVTHADRLVFAEVGLRKQDIADYYVQVAARLLPFVRRRPLTLVRCPQGHGAKCFFQRHLHTSDPEEVRQAQGVSFVDSRDGLVALVQHGVLELHVWGCTLEHLEQPDTLVFDLDPGPHVHAGALVRAAQHVRELLRAQGLTSFVKRTGGRGLHVQVPLLPQAPWEAVKTFAHSVAARLEAEEPTLYTASPRKAQRPGKVFIDYLRNARASSAVAPYSTRAHPGAPVALPMAWDALDAHTLATATTLDEARRVAAGDDPWANYHASAQPLTAELATL